MNKGLGPKVGWAAKTEEERYLPPKVKEALDRQQQKKKESIEEVYIVCPKCNDSGYVEEFDGLAYSTRRCYECENGRIPAYRLPNEMVIDKEQWDKAVSNLITTLGDCHAAFKPAMCEIYLRGIIAPLFRPQIKEES